MFTKLINFCIFLLPHINPIQDGPFRGCSRMGGQKRPLPKSYHICPTMMKLGSYTLPKEDQKIYKSRNTALEFC